MGERERFGGAGARFFHAVLAVEALSRVDASIGVLVDVHNTLVINALLRWGTDEQRARVLPRLASGALGAYALSEAGAGSDAFALTTRAVPEGEHLKVAEEYARQLLKNPPLAVRAVVRTRRQYLLENQRQSFLLAEASPALHLTRDFREAAKAFVEKRPPPRFEGR